MNYYNEWDKATAAWLQEMINQGLIPDGHIDTRSIADVQPSDLTGYIQHHFFAGIGGFPLALDLAGWPRDRPVWTASFPCQPVSVAGRMLGTSDERYLLPIGVELIKKCRPKTVFGEQVPSVEWIDAAWDAMERSDYTFWPEIRRADSVGAFQERRRVYWCATSNTNRQRQPEPWKYKQNPIRNKADEFREADRLIDAFRRKALPFLCSGHDGVSGRVGELCCKGFGNAIIPQVAAEFIGAYMDINNKGKCNG
jgi:DNA (cytosine-5)-methyltransferase 1